ncbi:O-antigen ligase [Motiliproteus sp. SC1-56]|uniref:O-antigen ligase family protein n=1 Tax=Motiliproteus sp. SC1-56 TaxID=2799565 RepID=UPI001A8CD133|nr:O-antigen ligase family protein [Motiliproteus sp. SC1-56]
MAVPQRVLNWLLSLSIFVLPAAVLTLQRGVGYGALPMLILSAVLLGVYGRYSKVRLNKTEWLFVIAMLAYPLAAALSMLFHGEWVWAHFDKPSRFLLALPVFFALRQFGTSENFWYWGLVVGAIGAGIFGYYQKYVQGLTVASGYTHKIPFGDISLILGALATTYLIPRHSHCSNRFLQVMVLVAAAFGLLGSIASGTRGGWIAIPFVAWLILSAIVERRLVRWSMFGALIAALILVYFNNDLVRYKVDRAVITTQAYFDEGKVQGSAGTRLEMWRGAWLQFQEEPWAGGGKDSYGPRLSALIKEGKINPGQVFTHAHNDFLNVLVELGILGGLALTLFYSFMLAFFTRRRELDLRLATAGLVLCFGYIDFSLTQAMLEHNISTTFLTFTLAILGGMLSYQYRNASLAEAPGKN